MQERNPSAKEPRSLWRRSKLLAGSLALTSGVFFAGVAATAGPASAASFPPVVSQAYTITGAASSVSNVTVAVGTTTQSVTSAYTVRFTTSAALPAGDTITVTCATAPACDWTGVPATVGVADLTPGNSYGAQSEVPTTGNGTATLVVPVGVSGIAAGDTVQLSFSATNPVAGTYTYEVTTTASTTAPSSPPSETFVVASGAPTVTTSNQAIGAGDTFTFTNVTPPATDTLGTSLVISASAGVTWSTSQYSYTVTDNSNANAVIAVNSVSTAANTATLTLASAPPLTHTFTVTANGTNPSTSSAVTFTITIDGNPLPTTSAITFGAAVTNATVAPTPSTAGSTSTWAVGFTSTDGVAASGTIVVQGPKGTTLSADNAVVTDTTTGVSAVATAVQSTTSTTDDTVTLTLPATFSIGAGNAVTVMLYGVTNPPTGSYTSTAGASVHTSTDPVPTYATVTIGTPVASGAVGPTVTPTSYSPGALANYTITPFKTASELIAGTDTIEVTSPSNSTVFPLSGYTLTDTTPTTPVTQTLTVKSGGDSNDVYLTLASNVPAGDTLSLTIDNIINPAGGSWTIELGADNVATNATVAGTQGLTSPLVSFPSAAASYPDAGIVNFNGPFYLFAGGHAFGIPNPTTLAAVQAIDKATVQTAATGATVPTAAAATGSVIVAYNNPTIYVVGTDGQLHGFATPTQFLSDGYDPADVITVPNLGGITVGATAGSVGSAANAAAVGANGAIVNSSGTFYVYAGGKAFGIPGPKALATVMAGDTATPITGTVSSTNTGATIRNGTLVTYSGTVYVANGGQLLAFKGMAQLQKDGYGGTPSIVVPNTGGLSILTAYAGS